MDLFKPRIIHQLYHLEIYLLTYEREIEIQLLDERETSWPHNHSEVLNKYSLSVV